MKQALSFAVLCLSLLCFSGCKTMQAPLPTNAINSTDAGINEVLQAGHAAALKYEQDVANGFVPTAALKATMKDLVTALNIADPLYQQYHAVLQSNPNAPEPVTLSASVTSVSNSLQSITTTAGK